jgi:hypothetical protein
MHVETHPTHTQQQMVYAYAHRFMDLARASSALSAKRGAAVGVARIARLAAAATPGGTGQVRMLSSLHLRQWCFAGRGGYTDVAGVCG